VNDGWTDIIGKLLLQLLGDPTAGARSVAENLELADFEKMEQIRARVDAVVRDTASAEALKPYSGSSASAPAFTTSTSRRSIVRTSRWSTPRAEASSGSPRWALWPAAASTPSTA
jgi:hypothetical protein